MVMKVLVTARKLLSHIKFQSYGTKVWKLGLVVKRVGLNPIRMKLAFRPFIVVNNEQESSRGHEKINEA